MSATGSAGVAPEVPPTAIVGTWTIARSVRNRLDDTLVSATGALSVAQTTGDLLTWDEDVLLHLPGGPVQARRRYLVERQAGGWLVRFDDGREFHRRSTTNEVVHHCGDDVYRGHYDLERTSEWSTRWECRGPSKDYTIDTTYRPDRSVRRAQSA